MEGLTPAQAEMAKVTNPEKRRGSLAEMLVGADVFLGVSAPNLVTPELIETMAPHPILFPLANPVPELLPDPARQAAAAGDPPLLFWLFQTVQWLSPEVEPR